MHDSYLPEDMPSVRYGASGALQNAGPQPHSLHCPAERPGARRFIMPFHVPAPGPPFPQTGPR